MKSKDYWRKRAQEYEREWTQRLESEIEPQLVKYFRKALKEIEEDMVYLYGKYGKDNGLTYAEARKFIRGDDFKLWRMTLKEYVTKSHTDSKILRELNTLAMRSRISRLEKLYTDTLIELQRLGEREEKIIADFLTTAYKERYHHGIFDLAKSGEIAVPVAAVQPKNLERVLAARWQGGNYSSRIWANKEKLSGVIKQTITSGLHRGLSVPKMSKLINDKMNAGISNAERLVRTEMNFVQNHAAKDSLQAAGLDEYEFIAVLDHRTTPRCQALDGTMHLLEEYSVGTNAPPMHPRCRSTISAVLGEKTGTRIARNNKGENIQVPASMTYAEYKKTYLE